MKFVSLFNEMIQFFFITVPEEKILSIYRFHSFYLVSLCCISIVSILAVKILANDTAILGGSMCFEIVLSIELERIFV